VVLSPDVSPSTRATRFRAAFPDRFICSGIAEQNTLGLAAGLATCGWRPLVAGYAMFVAGKAWEPLRNSVAYPGLNVTIAATHAGINVGPDGVTHQAIEDIALMRAVPGMVVLAPTDANQVEPVLRAALCNDLFTARKSREHNDANILVMGARVIGEDLAMEIVRVWLDSAYAGGRHVVRNANIVRIEQRFSCSGS
jgi:transketolase C-terminal domain/subunit